MAPMFLVSNEEMLIAGMNMGIAAAVPALNYRTDELLRNAIKKIRENTKGKKGLGINLICNKSNVKMP